MNVNTLGMTSPPSVENAELVPRRIFVGGFDDTTTEFELETFFKVSVFAVSLQTKGTVMYIFFDDELAAYF